MAEPFPISQRLTELPDGGFLEVQQYEEGRATASWSRSGATERLRLEPGSTFGAFTVTAITAGQILLDFERPKRTRTTTPKE